METIVEEIMKKITIHLLGDSLVTAYGKDEDNFIGGWGDHLQNFFNENNIQVNDYAQGGRSSRSFLNEGRFVDRGNFTKDEFPFGYGPAYDRIEKGDYVFIEFAHNDDNSKNKTTYIDRMVPLGEPDEDGIYPTVVPSSEMMSSTKNFPVDYEQVMEEDGMTEEEKKANREKYQKILPGYGDKYFAYGCGATYKGFLKFYIDKIRDKGAIPVLVTPVSRVFLHDGKVQAIPGHHGNRDKFCKFPYVQAMKQLVFQEKVLLIDLFEKSKKIFEMLDIPDAKYLQSIKDCNGDTIGESRYDRPALWPTDYDAYMKNGDFGGFDDTHQNRFGSFVFAGKIVEGIMNAYKDNDTFEFETQMIAKENFDTLKEQLLTVPTKNVACPEKIRNRLPEMQSCFQYLKFPLGDC